MTDYKINTMFIPNSAAILSNPIMVLVYSLSEIRDIILHKIILSENLVNQSIKYLKVFSQTRRPLK